MTPLSNLQIVMLKARLFHVDGWTSVRGREAADDLLQRGFVTCFESGSDADQYTALNYEITTFGDAFLQGLDV
jgi:hypothetical protein